MTTIPNGLRFLGMDETLFRVTFDSLTPHGWLSEAEARLLVRYASLTTGFMLEVGSYCGRSTRLLGTLARETTREVYCIDPWGDFGLPAMTGDQSLAAFLEQVAGLPVVYWRTTVEKCLQLAMCKFGFVYLDGDHTYKGTITQVEKALACHPQVIAAHDVNDTGGGVEVKRACLELLGSWTERVERLAVWDRRRIAK